MNEEEDMMSAWKFAVWLVVGLLALGFMVGGAVAVVLLR